MKRARGLPSSHHGKGGEEEADFGNSKEEGQMDLGSARDRE